jgi:hypothetical protein
LEIPELVLVDNEGATERALRRSQETHTRKRIRPALHQTSDEARGEMRKC